MKTVAPYAGAWIEMHDGLIGQLEYEVAPYAGAWIEISVTGCSSVESGVAPYAGAWIEIPVWTTPKTSICVSLPTRERGLKSSAHWPQRHTSRVAPYAGAWIEMLYRE